VITNRRPSRCSRHRHHQRHRLVDLLDQRRAAAALSLAGTYGAPQPHAASTLVSLSVDKPERRNRVRDIIADPLGMEIPMPEKVTVYRLDIYDAKADKMVVSNYIA
jgi:hypothetical protein